jgi:hypothetical protein
MSAPHALLRARLAQLLIESSKCESIDTGDAVQLIGDAHDAIAQLMATQSELLAALQTIADTEGYALGGDATRALARAAIAKAVPQFDQSTHDGAHVDPRAEGVQS